MKNRKLFTQIFSSFLIVVMIAIIAFGSYEYGVSRDFFTKSVVSDLTVRAKLVTQIIKNDSLLNNPEALKNSSRKISKEAGVRITVIRPDGKVLSDSHKNADEMDNHRSRPEVIKALAGKAEYSIRYSATLGKQLIYVAVPLYNNEKLEAVVRVAMPLSEFETVLFGVKSRLMWIGLIILILTAFASYIISKRVSAPLEKIQRSAERFMKGDFSKLPISEGSNEIVALVNSFNKMAEELDKRIKTISIQKSEQEAVFLSMKEGVLAINSSERILNINQAALKFFQIKSDAENVANRAVYEIIRNKEMLDFIHKSLNTREHLEEEITVYGDKERVLLVNADPLSTAQNEIIGTIVVMNDITRVKEWDKMRQDFVANVSHELKTPITSIKGYVETLLNGDVRNKEIETKFLNIISRHTNQLNAIIDDLLQLSKLDKTTSIETKKELLLPILKNAVQCCPKMIEEKNIRIDIK
ncbi:MAG: cell wall metabolism sensor histidine kinase WalK, partial [Chlorobi bacterium]|nr:cell wall metabolism sensor histidine kinase WalK [Chlorobiota bacterium]